MQLTVEPITLETRHAFRISREVRSKYKNFILHLNWEGLTGTGEAAPRAFYKEREQTVLDAVKRLEHKLDGDPEQLMRRVFSGDLRKLLKHDASVRAGIDMALWDLMGKMKGKPCFELLNLDAARTPETSLTIGFDTPDIVRAKVAEAEPFRILKVKMGMPGDLEMLDAIIDLTGKTVRVDANEGWDLQTSLRMLGELEQRRVELIEQPISHHRKEDLAVLKRASTLPIILDESVVEPEDVENCQNLGHGINIKLMKCGGITAALDMIGKARKAGLKVMLGCMIESSVAITAAAHLSPLADFADLDGNLLLSEDPFSGVGVQDGKLILPRGAGLGAVRKQ